MIYCFIILRQLVIFCMWVWSAVLSVILIFFFKQKTAYDMRISDWISDVCSSDLFPFDKPILLAASQMANSGFDQLFLFFSAIGYQYGVVPVDIALVLVLALRRRYRESVFVAVATGGSGLLNVVAKQAFARDRPSLWESIAPEHHFSFPSGHAIGSMTLAAVLVLLAWPPRWRWPVVAALSVFMPLVGQSRVSLGGHFPSDILAGWAAALAWTAGAYLLVFRWDGRPWGSAAASRG